MKEIHLVRLDEGAVPVKRFHDVQRSVIAYFRSRRIPERIAGVMYALEFEPTITFGSHEEYNTLSSEVRSRMASGGLLEDILFERKLSFYESLRGGGSTYLGPGQRSIMLNLDLRELDADPVERQQNFDEAIHHGLATVVRAYTGEEPVVGRQVDVGVHSNGKLNKLGSFGIDARFYKRAGLPSRVMSRYGVSFHVHERGLDGFDLIHACGLDPTEVPVASFERFAALPSYDQVDETFARVIADRYGAKLIMPDDPNNHFVPHLADRVYRSARSSHSSVE